MESIDFRRLGKECLYTLSEFASSCAFNLEARPAEEGVVLGSAEGLGSDEAVGNAQVQFSQQALVLALDLCTVSKVRKISK